ncbi:hypothetical protein FB451DRAFT_1408308 [Mycena latifolia]|nr:hypothetical protein FB451DRAFT_1408308 [Mycena latifolia]
MGMHVAVGAGAGFRRDVGAAEDVADRFVLPRSGASVSVSVASGVSEYFFRKMDGIIDANNQHVANRLLPPALHPQSYIHAGFDLKACKLRIFFETLTKRSIST